MPILWGPSEFSATGTLEKYERVAYLKKLNIPVLFVCGEFDEATPASINLRTMASEGEG